MSHSVQCKRLHIALAVADVERSIADYSKRLGALPVVVVDGRYALWRTEALNFSISAKPGLVPGTLRHLGMELPEATDFTEEADCNGLIWEYFDWALQRREIEEKFPNAQWNETRD